MERTAFYKYQRWWHHKRHFQQWDSKGQLAVKNNSPDKQTFGIPTKWAHSKHKTRSWLRSQLKVQNHHTWWLNHYPCEITWPQNSLSQPQSPKTISTNSRSITLAARSVFAIMIRTVQESRSQDSYDLEQQCFRSSRKYFHDQAIRHHVQNKAVSCHHRRF